MSINKAHNKNKDKYLDRNGANEVSAEEIKKVINIPQGINQIDAGVNTGELWVDTANGNVVKMGI